MIPLLMVAALVLAGESPASAWVGTWTYDVCHEDRRPDHDKETFCRQGRDRILVSVDAAGRHDITLCPADPWGERALKVDHAGRRLSFRSPDGLDVHLVLGEDRAHFRGTFRSASGHAGRLWGRRIAGCT